MTRKPSSCALCESSNLRSVCAHCANTSLRNYRIALRPLRNVRDSLHSKLSTGLAEKRRADEQIEWRARESEKVRKSKERLDFLNKRILEKKGKVDKVSEELRLRKEMLVSAFKALEKNRTEILGKINNIIQRNESSLKLITFEHNQNQAVVVQKICKIFPLQRVNSNEGKDGLRGPYDKICNVHLPRGIDPCSVPPDELAASLGYMIQLTNLVVQNLAAPTLHSAGFKGSRSRICQRVSYWDAQPLSKGYPLFLPSSRESSWSERSISDLDVSSIESARKPHVDAIQGSSLPCFSASSMETNLEVQKGISLLKRSVQCITAYCCSSLCLDLSSEASTFEALTKLLAILSSPKELQSAKESLKVASSSGSDEQVLQLDKSTWKENSGISSRSFAESMLTSLTPSVHVRTLSRFISSFHDHGEVMKLTKTESLDEGWDFVEHPSQLPPP